MELSLSCFSGLNCVVLDGRDEQAVRELYETPFSSEADSTSSTALFPFPSSRGRGPGGAFSIYFQASSLR